MSELPFGVTIAPPPPELKLDEDHGYRFDWPGGYGQRSALSAVQAAQAFPEPVEVDAPESLRTAKMFACSGLPKSSHYREATKFRSMQDMGRRLWPGRSEPGRATRIRADTGTGRRSGGPNTGRRQGEVAERRSRGTS
jgi:hypothetical protein